MVVPVPVAFGVPAMVPCTPPSVVALPAAIAFGVQVATAVFCLMTGGAVLMDGVIYPRLGLFDPAFAIAVILGIDPGHAQ